MSEIYAALAAVMADCTAVAKRDRNEHQRFLFRGIDAVVNAVGPILRQHSVVVVPDVQDVTYDTVHTSTGKPATACRVLAVYRFYAKDGSSVEARVAAEAWDNGDKATPKAMSVAFRTALLQALALPTDEPDAENNTYEQAPTPAAEKKATGTSKRIGLSISDAQMTKMHACFNDVGITDREQRIAWTADTIGREIESSKDLTRAEASKVIEALVAVAAQPFQEGA